MDEAVNRTGLQRRRFGKGVRLRRRTDFERAYRQGVRIGLPMLRVVAVANGGPDSRLGLAVGRRVGGAVCRNRLKRLLREVFRLDLRMRGLGLDVVVQALPGAREASSAVMRQELERGVLRAARRLQR